MRAKYLDLFTDFGFKKIFGEEANKAILIDFFNALLPDITPIKDLYFKKNEQLGVNINDRKAVFDIYCENELGEKIIVEMQKSKQNYFKERTIYYSTFPICEQAEKGIWDFNLKAVYCISLIDFTFSDALDDKQPNDVVYDVMLRYKTGKTFYDKLTYVYLEMPNFNKTEAELVTRLDKWLFFIKNLESFQSIPEIFKGDVVFMEAIAKSELAQMDEAEMDNYQGSMKSYRDSINQTNYAIKTAVETAIKEEKMVAEKALKEEKEASEKAVKEEKLAIAKALKNNGVDTAIIAQTTKLTIEEIEKI